MMHACSLRQRPTFALIVALLIALASLISTAPARAAVAAPDIDARSWLLIDMTTGTTLAAREPDQRIEPASLTKLMTAYLVFAALPDNRLTMDQRPPVSALAYKATGSRQFVDPRSPARVDELLNGLIVQSGNDSAIILAEAVGTTEAQFAKLMNAEAKRLGMTNSHFTNASGMPDPEHYSTARDMGILASRLIQDFPEYYKLYSQREYTYNNIRQPNRNRLLFTDPTVDGVKTGHTSAAGYCLISSATREDTGLGIGRRLLSVVIGASSESSRAIESQKLLNFGYQNYQLVRLYRKDDPLGSYRVFKGKVPEVKAGFREDVLLTVARNDVDRSRPRSSAPSRCWRRFRPAPGSGRCACAWATRPCSSARCLPSRMSRLPDGSAAPGIRSSSGSNDLKEPGLPLAPGRGARGVPSLWPRTGPGAGVHGTHRLSQRLVCPTERSPHSGSRPRLHLR